MSDHQRTQPSQTHPDAAVTPRAGAGGMHILVVDDETNIRKTLALCLEGEGHRVVAVSNPADARAEAARRAFDLAFVDLRLGAEDGLKLIPQLLAQSPWLKIIVMTAYASVDTAVASMKAGSTDYVSKPFTPAQIKHAARRVAELRRLEQRVAALEDAVRHESPETDLAGTTAPAMQKALHLARQVAGTDATVMIRGESGTGKTALARAIHYWSGRAAKPVAVVSCPAYTGDGLEVELFGRSEGGGETGGRVARVEGGTLVLDEIASIGTAVQPKLLGLVQDREYEPAGGGSARRADIRLVVTTHADLSEAAHAGQFREDLLYRLSVIQIELPPLRERADDVPVIAARFLAFFSGRAGRGTMSFAPEAEALLRRHTWPGNIHELRNVVERCAILAGGAVIGPEHLPPAITARPPEPVAPGAMISLDQLEEAHIRRVLAATHSLEDAAGVLGIDTATLWRRRKKYGI